MKIIETKKFSDTCISVKTLFPLREEMVTLMNIWVLMMRKKTQGYSSQQILTQELSKAYGMQASVRVSGYGNQVVVDFRFRNIRFDLVDDVNYEQKALSLIHEILFCPVFDEENLQEAKYILKNRLYRQYDDPDAYVVSEAMNCIEEDHSIRISLQGKQEDIETITLEDVQAFFQEFVSLDKHTYIVGICPSSIRSYFETFENEGFQKPNLQALVGNNYYHRESQRQITQSSIAQIYRTGVLIGQAYFSTLMVTNSMLGQSPSSLLFTNVREKHSLCYSISSSLLRFDGALLITTGTQKENIEPALELIEEQITKLRCQSFSDELLQIAKKDILDGFMAIEDNPLLMIEQAFIDDYLHREYSIEKRKADIMRVNKQGVANMAMELELVSQAILEGCANE